MNDFVIPSKNPQTAEQQRGRHFQIRFDPEICKYLIRDLGIGHGVFARLDSPKELKDNMIVNVGEAHIVVNLLNRDESEEAGVSLTGDEEAQKGAKLKLKIFGGPTSGEIFYFKNEGQEILVGRTPNCDVRIEDKLLSKTQCHIKCFDGDRWMIVDGYNGKTSTNGTWVYLNEDFEIYDGVSLKANQTIFSAHLLYLDAATTSY